MDGAKNLDSLGDKQNKRRNVSDGPPMNGRLPGKKLLDEEEEARGGELANECIRL